MDKLGRAYHLEVQGVDGSIITVELPFTVEFDITRNTLTSANVCQIRIYNLSLKNRNQIRKNAYDYGDFRSVLLKAGYGKNLPVVFVGSITQAWSVREGVDFITQIECFDGGFAFVNGITNKEFPAGTQLKSVVQALLLDLPKVSPGAVGDYPGTLPRGNSYSGNTAELLTQVTGGAFFVDLGKANVLGTDEYLASVNGTTVVNSQSGLLGTPVLEQNVVRFDMVFEPGLNVAHKIKLESITEKNFTGDYKVTAVKHRGMISEAVCGSAITTGEFFYAKSLKPVS